MTGYAFKYGACLASSNSLVYALFLKPRAAALRSRDARRVPPLRHRSGQPAAGSHSRPPARGNPVQRRAPAARLRAALPAPRRRARAPPTPPRRRRRPAHVHRPVQHCPGCAQHVAHAQHSGAVPDLQVLRGASSESSGLPDDREAPLVGRRGVARPHRHGPRRHVRTRPRLPAGRKTRSKTRSQPRGARRACAGTFFPHLSLPISHFCCSPASSPTTR